MRYWKKEKKLHVQSLKAGTVLICKKGGEWGTYYPLTDRKHRSRGYIEISLEEAEAMAEKADEIL